MSLFLPCLISSALLGPSRLRVPSNSESIARSSINFLKLAAAQVSNIDSTDQEIHALLAKGSRNAALAVAMKCCQSGQPPVMSACDALLSACRRHNEASQAAQLLRAIHSCGKKANPNQYGPVMASLVESNQVDEASALLETAISAGVRLDNSSYTMLITSMVRASYVEHASDLAVSLMSRRVTTDVALFNAMLAAMIKSGRQADAAKLISQLRLAGSETSEQTLDVLLKSFVNDLKMREAMEVFNTYCTRGKVPSSRAFNILIDGFARSAQRVNAEALAKQMRSLGVKPDKYTFNGLLLADVSAEEPRRALVHYALMRRALVLPDAATFDLLARALRGTGAGALAVELAREAVEVRRELASAGLFRKAAGETWKPRRHARRGRAGRRKTQVLDAGACDSLLLACMHAAPEWRERTCVAARWLWEHMQQERISATGYACAAMVHVLGSEGDFDGAKRVFEQAGSPRPQILWAEIIDVCNKCGDQSFALSILGGGGDTNGIRAMKGAEHEERKTSPDK